MCQTGRNYSKAQKKRGFAISFNRWHFKLNAQVRLKAMSVYAVKMIDQ